MMRVRLAHLLRQWADRLAPKPFNPFEPWDISQYEVIESHDWETFDCEPDPAPIVAWPRDAPPSTTAA